MVRNLSNPVHKAVTTKLCRLFYWDATRACSREPDNEKDATRFARWTALGKDLAGVFGSPQVIQSGSRAPKTAVVVAFFITTRLDSRTNLSEQLKTTRLIIGSDKPHGILVHFVRSYLTPIFKGIQFECLDQPLMVL